MLINLRAIFNVVYYNTSRPTFIVINIEVPFDNKDI